MPDLLTTDEAAAYLRLSERKLYELVANAAVPCTKLTGKWLFPKAALERWLAAGLLTPTLALAPTRPSIHRLARLARRPDGDRGLQDQRAGIVLPQCQCTGGVMLARLAVTLAAATIAVPAVASEPVLLHAAGSLRTALTEVAGAFEAASGRKVQAKYGPSGTLKDEILAGAQVFASANMEHPQALATAGKSGPVVLFARNRLCALVRPGLVVEPATILDRMLDANVRLGTSTPRADPSGDYAWEVFRKADR